MSVTLFHSLQSFVSFVKRWTDSGFGLVDPNIANMRAEICRDCHNNIPSGDARRSICNVCNKGASKALDAMRSTIISSRSTPIDSSLLACGICGCDLKISVHMPNHALIAREDVDAYPTFCWKKKILLNQEL